MTHAIDGGCGGAAADGDPAPGWPTRKFIDWITAAARHGSRLLPA
jgi:hypothetical protein